jgi:transposase
MAGKVKSMSTIKQLLHLHLQGRKIKPIASILEMSKNTVKAYLKKVDADPLGIKSLLALDDLVLEARFHAGSPAYKDDRFDELKTQMDYYAKELSEVGVTRYLLWEEYSAQTINPYSYSQFCYHLQQHLLKLNPSMVLTHKPAEKLFIDFAGKKLSYVDAKTGEQIECQVFIACLPYSDYCFAMAVRSQKVGDFIHALNC